MKRRPRLVGVLWRWHRRLGLLACLFVLVLAVTGIMLNHTAGLELDRRFIDSPWLRSLYGDDSARLPAFQVGNRWVSRAANGKVYLDINEVASCRGELLGAFALQGLLLAACSEELLLVTEAGELVEAINGSTGLPTPLQAVGALDEQVAIRVQDAWRLADIERMDFATAAPAGGSVSQQVVGELPADVRQHIPVPDQWLTLERVVLDLHSGRLFGRLGVLWVDMVSVFLCVLALSGTAMWVLHRRRNRRRTGDQH